MLPITPTEYKNLISKARTLKSQVDKNKLDTNLVKEFIDFTLKTAGENFDNSILTPTNITEMFKDYLKNEQSYIYKSGKYEHYWDYREDLSSSDLDKILKLANAEKTDTFAQAASYYI